MAASAHHRLVCELEEAAKGLLARSDRGAVEGDDVARAIGREPGDPDVYKAFLEIERRGTFDLASWGGAMNLPHAVRLASSAEA